MRTIFFIIFLCYCTYGFCQHFSQSKLIEKPPIDTGTFAKWPEVDKPIISNDGKYVIYTISNYKNHLSCLVLQSTDNNWKKEIFDASTYSATITNDNRHAIFLKSRDSLYIFKLGSNRYECIPGVSSYKITINGREEWLAYKLANSNKDLVLRNIRTGGEKRFSNVNDYIFSSNGKILLIQTAVRNNSNVLQTLQWLTLNNGETKSIFQINSNNVVLQNFTFDTSENRLVFMMTLKRDESENWSNEIFYYESGAPNAIILVNDQTSGIDKQVAINNSFLRFSRDGEKIFFHLIERKINSSTHGNVKVDVWSYADKKLQSNQLHDLKYPRIFTAVMNISAEKVIRLNYENEEVIFSDYGNDNYVLINKQEWHRLENYWSSSPRVIYVVSTLDGSRKLVKNNMADYYLISPNNKYVVYYDFEIKSYVSYNILTGKSINITKNINKPLCDEKQEYPGNPIPYGGINNWLSNDSGIIIYDRFDVWLVDPEGIELPINITNGYGRKHNIIFRLSRGASKKPIDKNEKLLLLAFDCTNKNNGFYSKRFDEKGDPQSLIMGPYIFNVSLLSPSFKLAGSFNPIKAQNKNIWIVQRMSSKEAPNYYSTKDFKKYFPLSNLQPQKDYNWLTTELIRWKMFDGKQSEGILYKPENFDSTKKYPIIFHFYEKKSNQLNYYIKPTATTDNINIAHFVSNGYLVFEPDIHYTVGYPGESVYNSVVSAAQYLSKMDWADSSRMGIQGHSFGGYEVNFLITRTNIFRAAASGAGATNFVSGYGSLKGDGVVRQFQYENGQSRIGVTLWERPELYIQNSPLFYADKVSTPLLMNNNKNDHTVPWEQGVEFFTALRRLGKVVWLLQYDKGGHQLLRYDGEDYTIRLFQFFDHYLKDKPAPNWMTQGIRAAMKGIETGYDLDPAGNCRLKENKCKVCNKWNEQYRKTPEMFSKPFNEWHLDEDTVQKLKSNTEGNQIK